MWKPSLSLLLSFFFFLPFSNAQKQKSVQVNSVNAAFASLNYEKPLPFNSIQVIDSRADTSKVGYISSKKSFFKLAFKEGFAKAAELYLARSLHANFSKSTGDQLLLVVKRFWFSEHGASANSKTKFVTSDIPVSSSSLHSVSVKLEVYLKQNEKYIPVVRIDTFYYTAKLKAGQPLDPVAFEESLTRLEMINFERLAKAERKLSWEDIVVYNKGVTEKPVLQKPVKQKGVFLTFRDFLHNKVQYSDFDIEQDDLTDQLFVKENGSKKLLTEFWGFCDGESYFIKAGFNFFELQRVGNTFEFQGSVLLVHHLNSGGGNLRVYNLRDPQSRAADIAGYGLTKLIFGSSRMENETCIYQVNMENGKLY